MTLPEDPMILLSLINMKLRDAYADLAALCEDMELDRAELEEKLGVPRCFCDTDGGSFLDTLLGLV